MEISFVVKGGGAVMLLFRFEHKTSVICDMLYDSFTYNEGRHDSYPPFPRSPLGTRGLQSREDRRKNKTPAFLESHSAKASSTNHTYQCHCKMMYIPHNQSFKNSSSVNTYISSKAARPLKVYESTVVILLSLKNLRAYIHT